MRLCMNCKQPVCSNDFGWYCCNQECELYDEDILAYEESYEEENPNELLKEDL